MRVSCTIVNTGDRAGEEVVQLYAYTRVRSVTRPVQELVGFARVALEPGVGCTVTFDVPVALLACIGPDGAFAVHPGTVTLSAGGSSADAPVSAGSPSTASGRRPRAPDQLLLHRDRAPRGLPDMTFGPS